jgi:ppGpp synthetase/RelA/SpoT-type nucleotidyltranferase
MSKAEANIRRPGPVQIQRFRGYDGLHFHVIRQDRLAKPHSGLVFEIQVMSSWIWGFQILEHDIIYKQPFGQPDPRVVSLLESMKGLANLGEIGMQQFEEQLAPGFAEMQTAQQSSGPILQAAIFIDLATKVAEETTKKGPYPML